MANDELNTHPRRAPIDGQQWSFDHTGIVSLPSLMHTVADALSATIAPHALAEFASGKVTLVIDWRTGEVKFSRAADAPLN